MKTSISRAAARTLLAATALSVALALAACSSGGSAPTPPAGHSGAGNAPSSSDSCTVVTHSDVSTALGDTVQQPVKGNATVEGGVACVFYGQSVKASDPDVPSVDSVRVVLVSGSNGTKWFTDYKSKVRAAALTGLGDSAFWDGAASVNVLKGSSYLRISVITTNGPSESAARALAATALPRM